MLGTYASAALICLASLLVGRALLSIAWGALPSAASRARWNWLEPAVGFATVLTVTGTLARGPGHGTSATLGMAALLIVAATVVWRERGRSAGGRDASRSRRHASAPAGSGDVPAGSALRSGLPVALAIVLVLSIPFLISGRWGLLGVGFNNDLGLHLAWAEWLRSGFGPIPDTGYHSAAGWRLRSRPFPGSSSASLHRRDLRDRGADRPHRAGGAAWAGAGAALLRGRHGRDPYLAASYFAQAAFKETAEALFVLAFAIGLREIESRRAENPSISGEIGPSAQEGAGGAGAATGRRGIWIARLRWCSPTSPCSAASSSPPASPESPGRLRSRCCGA